MGTAEAAIQEHLADNGGIRISILPMMVFISVIVFTVFIILQILIAKKKKTYFGYIGCGIEVLISVLLIVLYISDMRNYMPDGEIFLNSLIMFLLFNIVTVILLIATVLSNRGHIKRISEMNKISINDLE